MARFFIDRPIFAWVIAIIIMLAGALSILKLPVSMYHTVAPPAVEIRAQAFVTVRPAASVHRSSEKAPKLSDGDAMSSAWTAT